MGALGDTYAYEHTGRYRLDAVDQRVGSYGWRTYHRNLRRNNSYGSQKDNSNQTNANTNWTSTDSVMNYDTMLSNGQGNLHPTTTPGLPSSQHPCSWRLAENVALAATIIAALK